MEQESYQFKGFASLMLFGEYAVLAGYEAVVKALPLGISATLKKRSDEKIHISSDRFGEFSFTISDLSKLATNKEYFPKWSSFLVESFCYFFQKFSFSNGFDITITSEFSDQLGFGSSSAVTVAAVGALYQFFLGKIDKNAIFEIAYHVVKKAQNGKGSGADVAASVFGGLISYQLLFSKKQVAQIELLPEFFSITVLYSGSKAKTPKAIDKINALKENKRKLIYQQIGEYSQKAIVAIKEKNSQELGKIANISQNFLVELGASTPILDELVRSLQKDQRIFGAKISGAGFGDCVYGIGELPQNTFPRNEAENKLGIKQFVWSL